MQVWCGAGTFSRRATEVMRLIRSRCVESSKWVLLLRGVVLLLNYQRIMALEWVCAHHPPTVRGASSERAIFGHFVISSGKRRLVFSLLVSAR